LGSIPASELAVGKFAVHGPPTYAPPVRSILLAFFLGASYLLSSAAPNADPPCRCAAARMMNGWCDRHDHGYVGNVEVRSRLLYEALDAHGHTVVLSTYQCPLCQDAIATEGYCEKHRVGFVRGQAYYSRLTYELAKAEIADTGKITCRTCRKNAETRGWCPKCRLGRAGPFVVRDESAYHRMEKAIEILMLANEAIARCENCSVAIITDGVCPVCRTRYKDGRPINKP